jgi:hypothetical protein
MKKLSTVNFNLAREFVKANARPIDARLFEYTFENGKPEAIWDALGTFINDDGGFGHGIEPDCRLPSSSVLGVIAAFPYLLQTDAPSDLPLVRKGIRYLLNVYDRDLQGWRMLPPEVNEHPRAGWWNYDPDKAKTDVVDHWSNPSACVVAYLHRYHEIVPDSFLQEVTDKAMSVFVEKQETIEEHDYLPFIELAEALPCEMSKSIWSALTKQAHAAIKTDPAKWTVYGIRPLWAVPSPDSPLMEALAEPVNAHLDFEIDRQDSDGSWHPFWTWGQFDEEWKKAKIEWQGQLTVKLLRSLSDFGRIE